ncbi:MAG: glycosyltransferase [Rhodospirillales bacterium]|nr:glycosyltransferase [Rhodospirillales bacterium]
MSAPLRIVILGLSLTSSWGNGHATTYRGLIKELCRRGHEVTFLERDVPWYAGEHRDMPIPPFGRVHLYRDLAELRARFARTVAAADLVIIGSYVPEGVAVCRWALSIARGLTAFYDIDAPVTLAKLARGEMDYLSPDLVPRFDLYLSFSAGPLLERIRRQFGARRTGILYCSFDPELYFPEAAEIRWRLGYLGTYSDDRQPTLTALLIDPARSLDTRRFVVAGPQYPAGIEWPDNVERIDHVPPSAHRAFYNAQAFTLNVTRGDMVAAGWSPSVRLFEAAGCGVPVISDDWEGLDSLLAPGEEILIARNADDVRRYLEEIDEDRRRAIGAAARRKVLAEHSAAARARQLEDYVAQLREETGKVAPARRRPIPARATERTGNDAERQGQHERAP